MLVIYDSLRLWILFLCLLIVKADGSSARKLSYFYNPGCETEEYRSYCSNETKLNLIHITADSSEDSLHFLWSTWKLPSVIIARTSHNVILNVNWEQLLNFESGAISFSERPLYSIGLVIKELWEFTDDQDKVDMGLYPNSSKPLNLTSFDWGDVNATVKLTENLITAFPKSSSSGSAFSRNGTFAVKFSAAGEETASTDYPHLVFTGNSTQVQLVLDNLVTEGKKSRFAVELVALSSHALVHKEWYTVRDKSISDEFSPGVFRFLQLKAPFAVNHDDCEGVLSWKPVAYIGQKPSVANSSDAAISLLATSNLSVSNSIATSYFAGHPNVSQASWYMTFGTSGDGFYTKTQYTSWTLMVGTGDSVSQGLSKTAILVIAIGLGLPFVLMIIATIYLGVTQCRRKDDELLLSQDSMN